jgi:D-tagatose-1,6-bisphosphate aldolase subunit GatZ/KbaZ
MNLKKFKLGVGPMSNEIINLCLEYSKVYEYPLMIIASRNQVDATSGYVCTTSELVKKIKDNVYYNSDRILICRDHCGPYFSDLDQQLELDDAVDKCIETIDKDIDANFELIHIDVSRIPIDQQESTTHILIEHALSRNPNILFEYGSEDNTGEHLDQTLKNIDRQIQIVSKYASNLRYIVSQTGSLTKHTQVGNFSIEQNSVIAEKIAKAGFLFKEHNADYLSVDDVKLRVAANVDALNIAPQLGTIQSSVITDLGKEFSTEYTEFYNYVLATNYWKKWVTKDIVDDNIKFLVSAHYCFNSKQCQSLLEQIQKEKPFYETLKSRVFSSLDNYRLGFN